MAEIVLSPPCAHTHMAHTARQKGGQYKRVNVRKTDVNMNTVAGCHSPNGRLKWWMMSHLKKKDVLLVPPQVRIAAFTL